MSNIKGAIGLPKLYFIVEQQKGAIVTETRIGELRQSIYKTCPEKRKGLKIQYCGMICGEISLVLTALILAFPALFQVLIRVVVFLAVMFPLLIPIGEVIKRSGKTVVRRTNPSENKVGYWSDPYGLARNYVDDGNGAKKAYYIVDSETNAIVDVIRLGKWGQKWLKYRAERQANKTTE